ncbi:MAG: FMN-binding protein [Clostridia bacterium]|nr:FMN-binding protein [Clostridia bacterium]
MDVNSRELSRRSFLKNLGIGAAGAALAGTMSLVPALGETPEIPEHPWVWHPIDKQKALEYTYKRWFEVGGCGAGAVAGIMELLAEEYGYPYSVIPCRIMGLAAGGYGCQTLCGALAGACLMFGFFCEPAVANELRNQLFAWYRAEPFPTYQPEYEAVTTVAEDITCSASVNKFMKANNLQMGDAARKARCAALTGEVVVKAIELLNIQYGYEEAAPAAEEAPAAELAANEYIGTASTDRGELKVKVTMDGDKIAKIEVLSSSETPGICDPAMNTIPQAIIDAQSTEVDAVTNATQTSNAIMEAVRDALSQIKK